jgi:hypothetical protein
MKNSLLALVLAAASVPLTFAQATPPAQNPPANPPAATKTTKPKTKKTKVKKSHVKKQKPATTASTLRAK